MSHRPPDFEGFVGQRRAVRLLKPQAIGALARGEPFPNTLFLGPSGVGKTRLATSLAKAYGSKLIVLNGHDTVARIAEVVQNAETGDFVFVDEAHALSADAQHLMLEVIDNQELPPWATSGKDKSTEPVSLQEFTVALATDQPGRLFDALLKRMEIRISLTFYSGREMREICDRIATEMGLLISPQARNLVARLSGGLPRKARHLLQNLRRHFADAPQLAIEHVRRYMSDAGMDAKGLDSLDRRYLRLLAREETLSIEALASLLGCDVDHLRRQAEPSLRRAGLITIASRGRSLTESGRAWITRRARRERNEV